MSKPLAKPLYLIDLEKSISGEVLSDPVSLSIYATDASLYQIIPLAITLPRDEEDVVQIMAIARDHGVPVLPRGGGTSLAGQTVGKAIIIDFSKYMTAIIDFNAEEKWVRVQPGVVRDSLNKFLKGHGLIFSPDPATSSRANIGGMVGNNSSGTKSILYGKTVDHVLAMRVLLADGNILELSEKDIETYAKIANQNDREGNIYQGIQRIVTSNQEEIERRFPKVMRRVSGYNLDELKRNEPWNLAKLICGSEGTLGIILSIDLHLDELPKRKSVCAAHFKTLLDALKAVQITVNHGPAAVEILDNELLTLARSNLYTQKIMDFVEGHPDNILIIEFYGDSYDDIRSRQKAMIDALTQAGYGYAFPIFDEGPVYDHVWALRKKGLGILLGRKTKKKPIAFIEDSSVPVEVLPEYITEVKEICDKYDVEAAMYAHASVGVIHVRPIMDMTDSEDIYKMKKISLETFELVRKYGGSWSGEHGDGLVRSYLLQEFFGDQVYGALREVKQLFDPENLLNPGKIIDAQDISENLRYGVDYVDQDVQTIFKYSESGGFEQTVHLCSGVGECRKLSGTMCPSYHATRDEVHSTRGRANALRMAMSGQLNGTGLADDEILDTLDLCLSCKACKSECPSNVDMSKLKSEVLQMKYDQRGVTLRERFIALSPRMSAIFSGPLAPIVNFFLKQKGVRFLLDKVIGIEKKRILPLYSRQSFASWARQEKKASGSKVVLFADTYLNHHDTEIGKSAYRLLTALGMEVIVVEAGCCQRPLISNGFLKQARKDGLQTALKLKPWMEQGLKVLVCEPSCASALGDDLADLIQDDDLATMLRTHVVPIESYISEQIAGKKLPTHTKKMLLHGHCHQKALYGTDIVRGLFEPETLDEIDSGCCGMAGAFGYEKEHYALSEKIGDQRLFEAIRKDQQSEIIACGFSCRHQIEHFTGRQARHWVELVDLDRLSREYA